MTFKYSLRLTNPDAHMITATENGGEVGVILWNRWTGEILWIGVRRDYRRRGIATELYRQAQDIDPPAHHSSILTSDARLWIQSLATSKETA